MSGGVSFNILIQSDHCDAGSVFNSALICLFCLKFGTEMVLPMIIGYFKKWFFTTCDKMLNFVNFKNGGTSDHRRILDEMLSFLSNILMSKLTDRSGYLGV